MRKCQSLGWARTQSNLIKVENKITTLTRDYIIIFFIRVITAFLAFDLRNIHARARSHYIRYKHSHWLQYATLFDSSDRAKSSVLISDTHVSVCVSVCKIVRISRQNVVRVRLISTGQNNQPGIFREKKAWCSLDFEALERREDRHRGVTT